MVFASRAFVIFVVSPKLGGTGRRPDAGDETYTCLFDSDYQPEAAVYSSLRAKGGETRIIGLPTQQEYKKYVRSQSA